MAQHLLGQPRRLYVACQPLSSSRFSARLTPETTAFKLAATTFLAMTTPNKVELSASSNPT